MRAFGLIDCNNFFVSCEKVFHPELTGRPVVVLSNNDGCVISRSKEAKGLGIKMGVPAFEIQDLIKQHKIAVFSSNFTIYGDISRRVMLTIATFNYPIRVYSIDEAFVDLQKCEDYSKFAEYVISKVYRWTGVVVSVGISQNLTLAKLACEVAKINNAKYDSMPYRIFNSAEEMLEDCSHLDVAEVWGIGRKTGLAFKKLGITDVKELYDTNTDIIKSRFSAPIQKTHLEIQGSSCIKFDEQKIKRKQILVSRTFGKATDKLEDLEEALRGFVAKAAERLRLQNSVATSLTVFAFTNRHSKELPQYNGKQTMWFEANSDTQLLINIASQALSKIYRPEFKFKRLGVQLYNLYDDVDFQPMINKNGFKPNQKNILRVQIVDGINRYFGANTVRWGTIGSKVDGWQSKKQVITDRYTTNWKKLNLQGIKEKKRVKL